MATYIKTLKEDNGDITYPQTKAGAVLLNNGSDLETELSQYVTAEEIGSTAEVTPAITTSMIADGAVTSDKIDWTTLTPYWYNATNGNAVTIPKDGVYYISAQTSTNDVVGGLYIYYQKSGTSTWTAVSASYNSQSGWHNWSVQKVIALGAGDKVKITWPSQDPMQTNGIYSQFNIIEVLGASS